MKKSTHPDQKQIKKTYKSPIIKTEGVEEASATAMGGTTGGGGSTCNGGTGGGRKDTAGAGCSTLLT